MTPEQITSVYLALAAGGKAHAPASVAKAVKLPKADVERFVGFIKTIACFRYEVTSTGRLKGLTIVARAPGFAGRGYLRNSRKDVFYRNGDFVASISDYDMSEADTFEAKFRPHVESEGLIYVPLSGRIQALAPFLAKKYQEFVSQAVA
jgi:hypothetical protein